VSVGLLLDEMFGPRVATELVERGHDCLAVVADPALRQSSDAELLAHAPDTGRALVTNNVVDFERLRRRRTSLANRYHPLIYTSDQSFPRDRRFIGRLIDALDQVCTLGDLATGGGVLWLAPVRD